jgi:hypothetical protein
MFVLSMPKNFSVGQTAACRINNEPARVTWRDADTLVIEPGDARAIVAVNQEGDLRTFWCGDSGKTVADHEVDTPPGGGFVISEK